MQSQIENYPEVSFIENMTLEEAIKKGKEWYIEHYKEVTGETLTLHDTDERKLLVDMTAYLFYNCCQYVDNAGKMNLLKYAMGDFLDDDGAICGVTRIPAKPAQTTVRFTLSEAQGSDYTIPEGTRVTASSMDDIYFETEADAVIAAGETTADVTCVCTTTGSDGNGIEAGQIDELVDALPYIESVENLTASDGGADEEDDDALAERIYLAPSTYSTAGTEDSYVYHVKSASTLVNDVQVSSPAPCYVTITITSKAGMPGEELINIVTAYLNDKTRKVVADRFTVVAPDPVTFNIDLEYWISYDNQKYEETIKGQVEAAVAEYIKWQTTRIGRNVTPSKLVQLVMEAGASRVTITSPTQTTVEDTELAVLGTSSITYGGLEYE